jgi:hypothetical protein
MNITNPTEIIQQRFCCSEIPGVCWYATQLHLNRERERSRSGVDEARPTPDMKPMRGRDEWTTTIEDSHR